MKMSWKMNGEKIIGTSPVWNTNKKDEAVERTIEI